MKFYDRLSEDYDLMTRFSERLITEKPIMEAWVKRYGFRSALDAACGTGLHALLLAKLGVRVVGVDISPQMLERAKSHAREAGVELPFFESSLENLTEIVHQKFEAIFCLGNSLPHLLTHKELSTAVQNFYHLLLPGGIVVLQLLNYTKIFTEKNRIVGINKSGSKEFIRFYDFTTPMIGFNILTIEWKPEGVVHSLHNTKLYPYQKEELLAELKKIGFSQITCFGDMKFSVFQEQSSPNLVIVAEKKQTGNPNII
ncbi:MAG: hypothetical protein Kow0042_13320 [Calditrichia bacterium]